MSNKVLRQFANSLAKVCEEIKDDAISSLLSPETTMGYDVYRGRHQAACDLLEQINVLYKDAVKAQTGED